MAVQSSPYQRAPIIAPFRPHISLTSDFFYDYMRNTIDPIEYHNTDVQDKNLNLNECASFGLFADRIKLSIVGSGGPPPEWIG